MEEVLYEKQGGQVTWAGGGQTEAVLAKGAQYFLRDIIMWYFGTEGAILKALHPHFPSRVLRAHLPRGSSLITIACKTFKHKADLADLLHAEHFEDD